MMAGDGRPGEAFLRLAHGGLASIWTKSIVQNHALALELAAQDLNLLWPTYFGTAPHRNGMGKERRAWGN
jgi:hypothetical protein